MSTGSSVSLLDSTIINRVTPEETLDAARNIQGYAVHTPLVKLNYHRPDYPNLEIFLKLETLQPINSFKVRGAVNKIQSTIINESDPEKRKIRMQETYGNLIVSASAGNMGQGVAFAAKSLGCECIVIVPDHAPATKLEAMEQTHGAQVIKVPFARWWEILMTSDVSVELKGKRHLFVHPVCDPFVVAGNSTVGLEILQDLPDCDAVFCSWGGGGCSSGIGSVLKNVQEKPGCFPNLAVTSGKTCDMISVEPATAAPLCYSFNNEKTLSPLPNADSGDPNAYKSSWIDGCGGKSVLSPMWKVAKDVLTDAYKVELNAVERALKVLIEKNKVVAEGAGACPVAAAMFGPVKKEWKKVVAVVCGGCIDTPVVTRIMNQDFTSLYTPSPGFSFTQPIRKITTPNTDMTETLVSEATSNMRVLSEVEVRKLLPMKDCIEAVEQSLIAFSNGTGGMPLRQTVKLPFSSYKNNLGFLVSMPSYTLNSTDGDFAACKCFTVFPKNSQSGGQFSTHQGVVLLWNKSGNGELLMMADAHEVTKIRTAAASAVATRAILGKTQRCDKARVLSILGTGDQARSHVEAMMVVLPNLERIKIWGRDRKKALQLKEEIDCQGMGSIISVTIHDTVSSCIELADVICTVTSATVPILTKDHISKLKPDCHLNAIGACQPEFHELDPEIFEHCVKASSEQKIFTDSVDACLKEPGEVLAYLNKGVSKHNAICDLPSNFVALGDFLVNGKKKNDEACSGFTIFKSLGIALEDLYATKLIYERYKNSRE